jgi:glycosyltransferase involved in cell wall biosynthesis
MAKSNKDRIGTFQVREWVAGYATVYSRKAVDKIGLFDPLFKNGCEDLDFCRRLEKMKCGIIGQALDSFIFHFGGVSRGAYQNEDRDAYLREKWERKRVMIYSGPSWERWDYRNLEAGGIGGSEVWLTQLSRQLSNIGYKVEVFADCPQPGIYDGNVLWHHYTEYPSWIKYHWVDYTILSRTTDPLNFPLRAGKIFTQIHDIFYLSDKSRVFLDKIEKHGVLSQWHLDFVADYHKIPKDKLSIMANGIDPYRFDELQIERQPYRFHWSSSWDRGLDNVLYLWPYIRKEFPEAELHVYYGCHNWKQKCLQDNNQAGLKQIAELEEGMKQPGVFNHGRKSQKELAAEIKKASILLYPSAFSETFWITGIEAQYAGVPVICNKYAGVITTLTHPEHGDSAIMLGNGDAYWPYSKEGRESFLKETINLLKNKEDWEMWSQRGRRNAERFSWLNCALHWKDLFEKGVS